MRYQADRLKAFLRIVWGRNKRPDLLPRRAGLLVWAIACLLTLGPAGGAGAQMPDARAMSGIPRPVDDLPVGGVSVRVVRGDLAKVVADVPVELAVAGERQVVRTDAQGRAEFRGLVPGVSVRASATLDGERLESETFPVPSAGGVRILLSGPPPGGLAAAAPAASATAPAAPGTVVFGGDSRIVIQFGDDEPEVYYLLDVVNGGNAPVRSEALVLEMPPEAQGTTVLEGSSPQAVAQGRQVTIVGPFAPGRTVVQIAYTISPGSGRLRIAQRFPAALSQVSVVVQKVGSLTLMSPAIREQRETSDQGRVFLMGSGPGVAAGQTVVIDLDGLPHATAWPTYVALALASLVLLVGGWASVRTGVGGASAARERLAARREELLAEVEKLDAELRAGRIEARRHAARRGGCLQELERIYGALDSATGAGSGEMRHAG